MRSLLAALGRRLRPLLRPDWADEQRGLERLETLAQEHRRLLAEAARRDADAARQLARLDVLADERTVHALGEQVREVRRVVGSHLRTTTHALRAAELLDEQALLERALDRRVARAVSRGHAVAGPWTGEVGFELLYWIPFLRRLRKRLRDVELTVVARGGSGIWYEGIADRTIDAFDVVDVDTFRRETEGESRKQRTVSSLDRRLLKQTRRRHEATAGRAPSLIHPSLLYGLLYPYWKDQLPARMVFDRLAFERLPPPRVDIDLGHLPRPYVAVRFYFSDCFPDTPDNRAFAQRAIRSLAERGPVVLLNTPFAIDDHHDAHAGGVAVSTVSPLMTPANNLAVQSAVIAGASAFVGTYGGFSYLAPF